MPDSLVDRCHDVMLYALVDGYFCTLLECNTLFFTLNLTLKYVSLS